jgi:hypothetical protein
MKEKPRDTQLNGAVSVLKPFLSDLKTEDSQPLGQTQDCLKTDLGQTEDSLKTDVRQTEDSLKTDVRQTQDNITTVLRQTQDSLTTDPVWGLTDRQSILLWHLIHRERHMFELAELAEVTGMPYGTIRTCLRALVAEHFITKPERWKNKGAVYSLIPDICNRFVQYCGTEILKRFGENPFYNSLKTDLGLSCDCPKSTPNIEEEDIYNLLLREFPGMYPALSAVLHERQRKQIASVWKARGWSEKDLYASLDMADYAVSNNKDGKIKGPAAYVMSALMKGFFQRPAGYLSPEEKRLKQAEENLARIKAQKEKLYSEWKAGLSAQEKADILKKAGVADKGATSQDFALQEYFSREICN